MEPYFESMARAIADGWGPDVQPPPNAASFTAGGVEGFVDLTGYIDFAAEIARLEKEKPRIEAGIEGKRRQLGNEQFVARAPEVVIEKERAALAVLEEQLIKLNATLESLKKQL